MVDIVIDIYAYSNMYCTSFLRYYLGKQSSHRQPYFIIIILIWKGNTTYTIVIKSDMAD